MSIRGRTALKTIMAKAAVIFAISAPVTLAHGNDLTTLPDWNDEADAYSAHGLNSGGAQIHIADGTFSAAQLGTFTGLSNLDNTHSDTEGDTLWIAYQMYKRLDGVHQAAADAWYTRAQNLAGFFKNSYVNGNAWNGDSGFNFDHLYGWGLCSWVQGESDTSGISTINQIVSEMVAWNQSEMAIAPGESIFGTAGGGRRWGRQLRFAVCAAEVSSTTANRNWRDRVIDIVLQAPDWNSTYNMYFLDSQPTDSDSRLGAGAYGRGDRIAITYHMGIVMEALWHAWRVLDEEQDPRAEAVRQRLIDMASFYRDIDLDPNGFLQLNMGYNINTGARISETGYGTPVGVYSLAPINGMVMAYKLTGDQSFLNRAWVLYRNWQASLSGSSSSLNHFLDSDLASGTGFQFLANNKGELQYVYALFENGGEPTLVSGADPGPSVIKPMPPILIAENADEPDDPVDPGDPVATVTLTASPSLIDPGSSSTLTWSSTNATSCTASGDWSGTRPASGSESTGALSSSSQYLLTCSGGNLVAASSVEVVVRGTPTASGKPSWYAAAPERTWINMTSAVGAMRWNDPTISAESYLNLGSNQDDHQAAIRKWSGAVAREDFYVIAFAGGHSGGSGNVVYEFGPFTSENPDWHSWGTDPGKYQKPSDGLNWTQELFDSGSASSARTGHYSDGLPASRHTYNHGVFVPNLGNGKGRRVFYPWANALWSDVGGSSSEKASSFRFTSDSDVGGTYDPAGTFPDALDVGVGGGSVWDPVTNRVYVVSTLHSGAMWYYDMQAGTRSSMVATDMNLGGDTGGMAIDHVRRIIVLHKNAGDDHWIAVIDIDHDGRVGGRLGDVQKYNYSSTFGMHPSIEYHPNSNKFIGYDGGPTLYTLQPPTNYRSGGSTGTLNPGANYSWNPVTNNSGGASPTSDTDSGGLNSRMRYIESIDALAVIVNSGFADPDDNMYVYKVPEGGL